MTSGQRPIFVTKWGSTPGRPISFHHCLLVANGPTQNVTATTTGTTFDWGWVGPNGARVKMGNTSRLKPFDYNRGVPYGNSYHYLGMTDWENDRIEQLMNREGNFYNILNNNCQTVTRNTAGAIVYPTSHNTIEQARAKNHTSDAYANMMMASTYGSAAFGGEFNLFYRDLYDQAYKSYTQLNWGAGYYYDEVAERRRLEQRQFEQQLRWNQQAHAQQMQQSANWSQEQGTSQQGPYGYGDNFY